MTRVNRREFIERASVAACAIAVGEGAAEAQKPKDPSGQVKLGKTGLKTSLIGIGTGTIGWNHQSNQTRLGQKQFTEMMVHAYEHGIRLFDCADQYGSMPFLKDALKHIPREKIIIQTKSNSHTPEEMRADIDRFRKELGVDQIDIVLMHCMEQGDWTKRYRPAMDALSEAKQKKWIRAHGVSCHTLEALEAAAADPWVDIDLARWNPWGLHMDNRKDEPQEKAPEYVKPVLQKMKHDGKGVIAMKILAQGEVMGAEDRLEKARESLRFALSSNVMHAMVIGFESKEQVTQIVTETRVALAELGMALA